MEFVVRSQLILVFIVVLFNACQHYEEKEENYQLNDVQVETSDFHFNMAHFKVLLLKDSQEALEYRKSLPSSPHDKALSEIELIDALKFKEPSVKLLNRLSLIKINDLSDVERERYADMLFKFIDTTPKNTLNAYKHLSSFIKPWIEVKSLVSLVEDQSFKVFFKKVEQWRSKYKDHLALQIILGDFHSVPERGLKEVKTLALVAKDFNELRWFNSFVGLLDERSGFYRFVCLKEMPLNQSYNKLLTMDVDLVLLSGYSADDFKDLPSYHLPLPSIALMDPFDSMTDNLWFLPSKEYADKEKLKQLINLDSGIYVMTDSASEDFDIPSSRYMKISRSDYKEKILDSLEIPSRKNKFERYIHTSIDYFPLPSREFSTVVLQTSKELARLSYPYWKLKSPCPTTFIGRSTLLEGDVNLDRSLKGMILPKTHYSYNPALLFELIHNFRNFFIDKSFTLTDDDKVILRLQDRTFLQEDQFVEYKGT